MAEKTYQKPDYIIYLEALRDAFVQRLGDDARRRIQEHLAQTRLGSTENCVSIYDAAVFLDDRLRRKERENIADHVLACDGCRVVISDVIVGETKEKGLAFPLYAYAIALAQIDYERERAKQSAAGDVQKSS